jgi:hypothetical protein
VAPVDGTGRDVAFVVDVLVTWIGAAALVRYVMVVGEHGQRSPLERRARLLVGAIAATLFIRGFSWLKPESVALAYLTFLPITLLPLAMAMFAEGLLRRHVPGWMKLLTASAMLVAFVGNTLRLFIRDPDRLVLIGFIVLASLVVTMVGLGVILLRRDQASLSRSENALVRVCTIVTAFALPLAATDFRYDLGWPMVRLGTLGALLLCYTLLRQPQENVKVSRWLADVGRLVLRALLFAILIAVALQTMGRETIVPILVLGVAVVFAFAVFDRLRDLERTTPQTALLRWLARERPASWQQFARELRALPLTADATVLDEADLAAYDRASLVEAFPSSTVVQSLASLRSLREGSRESARGADELSDLLERHGATHVGLLAADPIRLVIATVPELPGLRDVELALGAVVRRGQQLSTQM